MDLTKKYCNPINWFVHNHLSIKWVSLVTNNIKRKKLHFETTVLAMHWTNTRQYVNVNRSLFSPYFVLVLFYFIYFFEILLIKRRIKNNNKSAYIHSWMMPKNQYATNMPTKHLINSRFDFGPWWEVILSKLRKKYEY